MTIRDIIAALLRRWYIPLVIGVCAALATVMLARDGGIYTTHTVISFMRPDSTSLAPGNGTNDSSVIAFAGAVVLEANNGRAPASYSTQEAPFFGAGIREGVLISLANSGNQWVTQFDKAEIEVQIVGRSYDWVEARQEVLVDKILGIAESQQAAVDASASERITASVVPLTSRIDYISPSRTSQLTAVAAMGVAAVIVSAWVAVIVDRRLLDRRSRTEGVAQRGTARTLEGTTL